MKWDKLDNKLLYHCAGRHIRQIYLQSLKTTGNTIPNTPITITLKKKKKEEEEEERREQAASINQTGIDFFSEKWIPRKFACCVLS